MLILQLLIYTLTIWLGLYLLRRDWRDARLFWTGVGLLLYAATVAALTFGASGADGRTARPVPALPMQLWWLLALPALCWMGAALALLPAHEPWREHLARFWRYGQWPLIVLLAPLFVAAGATANAFARPLQLVLAGAVLAPLVLITMLLFRARAQVAMPDAPQGPRFVALLGVLIPMLGLSMAALLLPFTIVPPAWIIMGMGLDLLLLGFVIGGLDAFTQGETLLPDLLLSLDATLLYVLLFGGLVGATMLLSTGVTPPMLALLLATIGASAIVQAFAPHLQHQLDRLALGQDPELVQERAELRALADTLPRLDPIRMLNLEDEEAFVRQVRRALSQMEDLTKLSVNPLIDLPLVQTQLAQEDQADSTLARAQALKSILEEAIQRLKPASASKFEAVAAWRYYNALYFPYVVGLKPYSRRTIHNNLEPAAQEALAWFRSQVPERTLYNWQNAGARLVAQYIAERHTLTIH